MTDIKKVIRLIDGSTYELECGHKITFIPHRLLNPIGVEHKCEECSKLVRERMAMFYR